MGFEVISIEIVENLVKMAKINLSKMNMHNASFHIQDGKEGFPQECHTPEFLLRRVRHNCPGHGWTNLVKGNFIAPVEQDSSPVSYENRKKKW